MKNHLDNLKKWQVVAGAVVATVALWGVLPDEVRPMSVSQHNVDANFTIENISSRNISYHLSQICTGRAADVNYRELGRNYEKYEEATGTVHWYKEMDEEALCIKVLGWE